MRSYKITDKDDCCSGTKCYDGLMTAPLSFDQFDNSIIGGIYYAREDIFVNLAYGPWIREVILPDGEQEYVEYVSGMCEYKARRVILGPRREINFDIVKELIDEGANAKVGQSYPLRWATERKDIEIIKLLLPLSDPKDFNFFQALWLAIEDNLTDIVEAFIPFCHSIDYKNIQL